MTEKVKIDPIIVIIEENFRWVCGKIKKKGREILSDFEITPPQFEALQHLIKEGDLTIGELSNKMYLACSTVTDLLDRMERNNLVVRVKDEKDRRIVRIKVLDKGHQLIEQVLHTRQKYLSEVLAECDDQVIEHIHECFEILNNNMEV
ncbi:MarR family winged helix-turn-helix transcriptional regulator [Fusibacter sp. JL216-2]|uniref:MarR family winged helix-turn-helix transcriptional regulator n=1 Tax=Fusibacter sp. JL216-2 TaxID=3071453 RepID=UPI003D3446F2